MSILKGLPTAIWLIGATAAITSLSPVVGEVVTEPSAVQPVAVQTTGPGQPAPSPGAPTPDVTGGVQTPGANEEGAGTPPGGEATATPPTNAPSAGTTPAPADDTVVIKTGITALGKAAVDGEGMSLYLSVLDSTKPPRSVCLSAACVAAWKPVYLRGGQVAPTAGQGVDSKLLGSVRRPDGSRQATLNGWPLYRFSEDRAPGETKGEGLKGTWHVIGPDGKKVVR